MYIYITLYIYNIIYYTSFLPLSFLQITMACFRLVILYSKYIQMFLIFCNLLSFG